MALSPGMQGNLAGTGLAGQMIWGNGGYDAYKDGIDQGKDAVGQYLGQAEGYMDPYRQAGQNGLNNWQQALGRYQDPTGYYNKIAGDYQMSPGAQFRMKTGMDAVRNAMASQGLGGSGAEAKGLTDYTQGVIGQDQQQYINNVLGIGNTGVQGYGDLSRMGYGAAANSGNWAMGAGSDIAGMDTALGQAGANQFNSNQAGMSKMGGAVAGMFM